MKELTKVLLLTGALVTLIGLAGLYLTVETVECERKGGALLRGALGYVCVKVERAK